jgi:hypothetical protein
MRPPLRSTPPSSPSPYRYLGRGGGERPVRVQLLLALVAALVLVAVPLYLWRRPRPAEIPTADAAPSPSGALDARTAPGSISPTPTPAPPGEVPRLVQPQSGPKVEVAPVKTLKCQDPGPGRTPAERCDGIRFFEDALVRAIKDTVSCVPPSKNGYVASFVLEMHFGKRRASLSLGKSTNLPRARRKEVVRCVERALPTPEWDRIPHQHLKYTINTVATYPPMTELDGAASSDEERASAREPSHSPPSKGDRAPTRSKTKASEPRKKAP